MSEEIDNSRDEDARLAGEWQLKSLAERLAKTADKDMRDFLSGVLKATESTLTDLKAMRERLEKAEVAADVANIAAKKAQLDATDSVLKADIRAEAKLAGALDAGDVLPLVRRDEVKFDDEGKSNIAELMAVLKTSKPYLFGKTSTSALFPAPKPGNVVSKNAMEMTPGEYRIAKAKFIRR